MVNCTFEVRRLRIASARLRMSAVDQVLSTWMKLENVPTTRASLIGLVNVLVDSRLLMTVRRKFC